MFRTIQGLCALVFASMFLALGGCNSGGAVFESTKDFPQGTGFQQFTVKVDDTDRRYSVFIPRDYSPQKKYPAIVFLHGVLESGNDATKNLGVGIGPHVRDQAATWQFITIFPQSPSDWTSPDKQHICIAVMDDVSRRFSVDQDRVILTGLSNGGEGTWIIGAAYKNRFAGLVPIAGYSAKDCCDKLTGIPIWCFHNGMDFLVLSGGSADMCQRINDAGGTAKYTQTSGFGHGGWDDVYTDLEVIKWMLAQRRGSVPTKAAAGVP